MLDRQRSLRLAWMLVVVVACAPASRADAQPLSLQIRNGLVTLTADNVPLRDILREWGRVSGAVIVNGDKVENQPITLRLVDAPERAALATLLRNVSGYVLASRADTSAIDRILILPGRPAPGAVTTAATSQPRPTASVLPPASVTGATETLVTGARGRQPERASDVSPEDLVEGALASTVTPRDQRPPVPLLRPSEAPDAANPFGKVPGSATPGVITPAAPTGVFYPPVTNPTLGRSQDGTTTTAR